MCVFVLCLAFSLLKPHPSLLFPHGHFETTPDNDFTDDPVHTFLPYLPVVKAQDMRHSAYASRSLATWPSQMQTQFWAIGQDNRCGKAWRHLWQCAFGKRTGNEGEYASPSVGLRCHAHSGGEHASPHSPASDYWPRTRVGTRRILLCPSCCTTSAWYCKHHG